MDRDYFEGIDKGLLERFEEYHLKNPRIYTDFCILARSMKAAGRKKYSAWIIVNTIRWDHDIKMLGDVFKINNDFIALYARKAMNEIPALRGFFEVRHMKAFRRSISHDQRELEAAL